MKSNLDLVNDCDNFPYPATSPALSSALQSQYHRLTHGQHTIGYITSSVVAALRTLSESQPNLVIFDDSARAVSIPGASETERSANIAIIVNTWRASGQFAVLSGWRDELYTVYAAAGRRDAVVFSVERAASALFGVITYGVHMTVYVREPSSKTLRIWVPRRSATKQTYPGMLDNSVAGGMGAGEVALKCLVREAQEEASLPESLVREHARACGAVTYFYVRDERAGGETGLLQPECQFVYDLELTNGEEIQLQPGDEEAEGFALMGVDDVKLALGRGEFKPNCALVLLDFLIRHGLIAEENDENYIELVARLHRRLDFAPS
ncbi:MAG: hypothetical protein M1825_003155 [Sarcosagium campestre]|nr:MAG: hypothetical protein M1825_003155 [Sarcosagium campestre]